METKELTCCDLMVGDLVSIDNKLHKVTGIQICDGIMCVQTDYTDTYYSIENYEPIPLTTEQQSNSLDKFIQSLLETYPTNKNEVPTEALNDYHQGLICGARKTYNWILRSALDGEITKFFDGNLNVKAQLPKDSKCCFGDKVKVIVIKEDK